MAYWHLLDLLISDLYQFPSSQAHILPNITYQSLVFDPGLDVGSIAKVSNDSQTAEAEVKHLDAEKRQQVTRAILKWYKLICSK